jgi:hypothetical protein
MCIRDRYRSWMDLGAMVSNKTDHVWLGLKPENNSDISSSNRMDAVLAWGDNGNTQQPNLGADVFRFIFTAYSASQSDSPQSRSQEGLEIMRMYPDRDTTSDYVGLTYGRVGIGDFTTTGVNEQPTHKLDVVGNGRFRSLPDSLYLANQQTTKFVMVDEQGVLRWTYLDTTSGFGVTCEDTVGGMFTENRKVDLNNFNFYFEKNDALGKNHVGIGYDCSEILTAKLSVRQAHPASVNSSTTAISGINIDTANTLNLVYVGVEGKSIAQQPSSKRIRNIGGSFYGTGADFNYGVNGVANSPVNSGSINTGGQFIASNSVVSIGVNGQGNDGAARNVGVNGIATSTVQPSTIENIGGSFVGAYSNGTNYGVRGVANFGTTAIGVYGTALGAVNNYAGYFDGQVYISGTYGPSDAMLKENVQTLESQDSILNLLNPVSFNFKSEDFPQFNFNQNQQFGLIAQEAELILPNIVSTVKSPVKYDSLGTVITESIEFKAIDYSKLIPILIAGHKEQTHQIDSLTTHNDSLKQVVTDLNNRLTQLENCLSNILPLLCQMNNTAIQPTLKEVQDQLSAVINVNLSDKNSIVLNQNVPNPFAESTVITYSVPLSVQKAQIQFNDGQGKLIKTVDISERGNGQLNVFANDLSSGVYTYTLVADGQIIATKRMVKQ